MSSELAGEDVTVARVEGNISALIVSGSARELCDAVPTKILNQSVARDQQVPITSAFRWMQANPDWAESLRSTGDNPAGLTTTVDAMIEGAA